MRRWIVPVLGLGLVLPPQAALPAGDRDTPGSPAGDAGGGSAANRVTVEQQEAIDRGLEWLAAQQDAAGGFPAQPPGGRGKSADYQTAVTALCTLAFLGEGHGLSRGPCRNVVRKGVDWLLKAQDEHGYVSFSGDNQSRMHGHGFATLALAEAYGTAGSAAEGEERSRNADDQELRDLSRRLKAGAQAAVRLIEEAQSITGGWGYTPDAGGRADHEGSVTVCQVQALLAASNRGFEVSMDRIKKARDYMKRSQTSRGAFRYRLTEEEDARGSHSWALASAGVVSLVGLSEYARKEAMDKAFEFLDTTRRPRPGGDTPYYYYGSFYAVQAYHWAGGDRWERFWGWMRKQTLEDQTPAGCWTGQDTQVDLGPAYPTAMSLLKLEVPVGYLSIFAR